MFKQPTIGSIDLSGIAGDGRILWRVRHPNTLVYTGVDLIARMLAWEDVRINAAYLEFMPADGSSSGTIGGAVDPAEGRDYYQAIDEGHGPGSDYLRVPIVTPPYLESTDTSKFAGNRVVFSAFSVGSEGINHQQFGVGARIFGLALVYAPDMNDRTRDIVFARSYGFEPREKTDVHQIMLRWAHVVGDVTDGSTSSSSSAP